MDMERARKEEKDKTSVKVTPVAPAKPAIGPASLNVEHPKFNGDPLTWKHFKSLSSASIKTRAAGYSELNKQCLLSKSFAQRFTKDDIKLDQVLECLRKKLGHSQVLCPLVMDKVITPDHYSNDYKGFQKLYKQIVGGYDAVRPHLT